MTENISDNNEFDFLFNNEKNGYADDENNEDDILEEDDFEDPSVLCDGISKELSENGLYEHYRFNVDKGQKQLRIDKYLTDKIVGASRNRIQNAADAGFIFVNEKPHALISFTVFALPLVRKWH